MTVFDYFLNLHFKNKWQMKTIEIIDKPANYLSKLKNSQVKFNQN